MVDGWSRLLVDPAPGSLLPAQVAAVEATETVELDGDKGRHVADPPRVGGASETLRGELPPGADANFRQLAASLANSDLGAVVGLNLAERELAVRVDGEQAHLEAPWPADVLARGLRVLFVDELEALLEEPVLAR